jgi:hypothetical protein
MDHCCFGGCGIRFRGTGEVGDGRGKKGVLEVLVVKSSITSKIGSETEAKIEGKPELVLEG